MQDPPAEQGLEGRQEGQLHKARVERVQHSQAVGPSQSGPAVRRLRDRRQLVLHCARVL